MNHSKLYIGVMSGTSMDGVDVALVEIEGERVRLLAHHDYPMPTSLKQSILSVCTGQNTDLKSIGELDHQLGHLFSDAVLALLDKSGYSAHQIRAIGNHGQTVFHQPTGTYPFSTQLGDANIIAVKTGIDTVADFRRKDIALGGQGAPLVPAFHNNIFSMQDATTVVLNVGGIANISVLHPQQAVTGYDTGPGNMLMDAWCEKHTGQGFDKDALFALSGQVHPTLLQQLLQDPYFTLSAPKSTGREQFNLDWLNQQLVHHTTSAQDVQRTLCEYSAVTIANEVEKFAFGDKPQLLVCGGGAKNPLLMERLATLLAKWHVSTTDTQGVSADYMEAMAFAWLAQRYMDELPSNLPDVTGASRLASLGVLYRK
ncbi:anhydro-N-acetylmuramic acid kinase [Vibrio sagamiensis]|uniref:Anhydro-N-acetylmuramic acid kinase n=1 Tax=Vibrio sagamiensis NBRC 104589 TaxID=1219064 RepID=A0A511QA32_9VIBR|nr:anhydro-N-acetylmuramic acid kinase [Vibrio sagamiensis]PNQ68677.1 anhydro-N-acetylmuramic acid kinase [Vibrio agarivorans]GEM74150.1 anhydro-N-acetylmuramic acid kinase [Vibrio sagamiensis NBRC 104589]